MTRSPRYSISLRRKAGYIFPKTARRASGTGGRAHLPG